MKWRTAAADREHLLTSSPHFYTLQQAFSALRHSWVRKRCKAGCFSRLLEFTVTYFQWQTGETHSTCQVTVSVLHSSLGINTTGIFVLRVLDRATHTHTHKGWTTSDFLSRLLCDSSRSRLVADDVINKQISHKRLVHSYEIWHSTAHMTYNSLFLSVL